MMLRLGYDGMLVTQMNFGVGNCILQLGYALLRAVGDRGLSSEIVFYVRDRAAWLGVADRGGNDQNGKPQWVEAPRLARTRASRICWQQLCMPTRARKDRLDVFHATGYVMPLRMRIPTVLSVFDLLAFDRPELCKPSNRLHYRGLLPASIRHARHIITPSAQVRRQILESFSIPEERVSVVPPGVDEQFGREPNSHELELLRRRFALPEHFILFAGQREPKKNLVRLVEAFLQARDRGLEGELVLVGGSGWGADAARVGAAPGIRQLGYVSRRELAGLYWLSSEFAFPSLAEGFGLPALEAMASGTVVVSSEVPSVVESDRDAAVIVDPLSVDSIAAGLIRARNDSEHRKRLKERGPRVAARFTWGRAASETLEIYQRVLS